MKTAADIPAGIAIPDEMDTRLGKLTFADGAPSDDTVEKVFDHLDFTNALNAYMNGYQLASLGAMRNGLESVGVEDNGGVLLFSELMDSQSLFLTANACTSAKYSGQEGAFVKRRFMVLA